MVFQNWSMTDLECFQNWIFLVPADALQKGSMSMYLNTKHISQVAEIIS